MGRPRALTKVALSGVAIQTFNDLFFGVGVAAVDRFVGTGSV